MNMNDLAKMLADGCYGLLAANFIWGLYNIIMGYRRVKELNFRDHDEQAEFVDEVIPLLEARRYEPCRSSRSSRSPTAGLATINSARWSPRFCSAT
jgi:hypothetical protein